LRAETPRSVRTTRTRTALCDPRGARLGEEVRGESGDAARAPFVAIPSPEDIGDQPFVLVTVTDAACDVTVLGENGEIREKSGYGSEEDGMSEQGAQILIERWVEDEGFRQRLRIDPVSAVRSIGLEPTVDDEEALRNIDWSLADKELEALLDKGWGGWC
jgi:hypothetical protein